jgi:hypothetical protein
VTWEQRLATPDIVRSVPWKPLLRSLRRHSNHPWPDDASTMTIVPCVFQEQYSYRLVLVTVCGIPNSAEFAFPTTQSVELLRRERRRAVRPSWGEYRDQRHRSKRTNVVRTRGELGKADADVSKDAPFDARRPPDRVQNTRGRPTYNKSLFYCRFVVIPAWVVRSMPLAGAARLAQG